MNVLNDFVSLEEHHGSRLSRAVVLLQTNKIVNESKNLSWSDFKISRFSI